MHIANVTAFTHVIETVLFEWPSLRSYFETNESRSLSLVWRTQLPGHEDRAAYKQPGYAPLCVNKSNSRCKYTNWGMAEDFDEIARTKFIAAGHHILDMSFLYQRPDGHTGDCLHWCAPGPLNTIGQVFLSMLQQGFGTDGVQR
eukprot:TRINITY_DN39667_c0_g2_i1.p1 TRINITY_DN39667_c0_g2~~TRINITY_DN39667_c0_g2_i1.p1  ORF type:complete len:161 (-),score=15.43 TRINITY_DN39667_c0_g2_i1:24-455(-)